MILSKIAKINKNWTNSNRFNKKLLDYIKLDRDPIKKKGWQNKRSYKNRQKNVEREMTT